MSARCMFDTNLGAGYQVKPSSSKVGLVRKRMRQALVTEEGFFYAVDNGYAWTPGILVGGMARENWISQQIIGLDFDNKGTLITPDQAIARMVDVGITPAVVYDTYSSTPDARRFRIALFLEEACEDPDVMEMAIAKLLALFPEADKKCKDLARLFFGGWHTAVPLYGEQGYARTDIRTILALPDPVQEGPAPQKRADARPKSAAGSSIGLIKSEYDLLHLVQCDTDEFGRKAGTCIRFHNCPICGHHDCFCLYPETNSWTCFSSSNATGIAGGSAIDYLMARDGISVAEAITILEKEMKGESSER